jgi:hypothetical protein
MVKQDRDRLRRRCRWRFGDGLPEVLENLRDEFGGCVYPLPLPLGNWGSTGAFSYIVDCPSAPWGILPLKCPILPLCPFGGFHGFER